MKLNCSSLKGGFDWCTVIQYLFPRKPKSIQINSGVVSHLHRGICEEPCEWFVWKWKDNHDTYVNTQKKKPECQSPLQNTEWLLLIGCTGWVSMFPRCTRLACYCQCICITNVSTKKVGFTSHFPTIIFEWTLVICQHGKQQQNYVRQRPNGPQNPKLWKPTALNNAGQLPAMGMQCCFHVWFFFSDFLKTLLTGEKLAHKFGGNNLSW